MTPQHTVIYTNTVCNVSVGSFLNDENQFSRVRSNREASVCVESEGRGSFSRAKNLPALKNF